MPADQPAPNQNIPASTVPATQHPNPKNYPKFYLLLGFILVIIAILTGIWVYLAVSKKNSQIGQNPTNAPSGKCYIGSEPVNPGDLNPLNECEVCDPAYSVVEWKKQSGETLCQNNQGICSNGQCVPKVQPLSLPETATDSSGFSSKPPTN